MNDAAGNRPLKIGMVCYPTYGGSGAVAAELGLQLAGRGHQIHFISYSRPFRLAQEFHENIYYHQIDTMEYPLFPGALYGITTSVRIYDIIREEGLDIIHAHYALPHAVAAYMANEMLDPSQRVPVLTTLHGTDVTLVGTMPSFLPAVKLGLDKSDGITCVSKWLSDRTCKYFDICERLNIIYNFVDSDVYRPRARECRRDHYAAPDEAVLLHVSNFRPVKRLQDVIRAFAVIAGKTKSRLLLVGDGPERSSAMQLAAELGVTGRIKLLGEQQEVRQFFAISDLFLFPSDGESFGLAAAEALASEVPVIGARAGGLPEVVADGETGLLFPVGDYQAMAEAAISLIRDPRRRRAMGKAGRKRMIENFSPGLIVPKYENYYRLLIKRASERKGLDAACR
ncbi:N-acetyl-alpha-D-glucosaminyl L-malate synthase BshA [Candidatus Sumerlaeota bacterium]|nr:N-acetyl-alpha-D-glucosaminyl L-malate synthase BshA [Candidatus Sumerlaeota bacterium]